jgi:uncharacterized membrane protein YcfT
MPLARTGGMRHPAGAALSGQQRLGWVDVAKGFTMILVVMLHSVTKHYLALDWAVDIPAGRAWRATNFLFEPMRMPLFFLLSGLLAASSLSRDAVSPFKRRVVDPYLLYLLWFCLNAVVLAVFDFTGPEALTLTVSGLLRNVVFPHTTLWYMLALVGFFAAAKLLRPLGVVVPVLAAAVLSSVVFAGMIDVPRWMGMTRSMALYFPLFLVGAYLPSLVHRAARADSRGVFFAGLVVYLGVAVAYRRGGTEILGFGPLATAFGAGMGVLIAVRLTSLYGIAAVLQSIGRRTLPIFVLHVPFLAVLHWGSTGVGATLWAPMLVNPAVALVYPALATAANLTTCLAVHAGLQRAGMGWLFSPLLGRRRTEPAGSPRPAKAHVGVC